MTTEVSFTDYSIENDKEAQKDLRAQNREKSSEEEARARRQEEFFNRFRQEFGNNF